MNRLPTNLRAVAERWAGHLAGSWAETWSNRLKDRLLVCGRFDCSRSRRAWQRISNGAGSLQLNRLRYCFPGCFERELARRFENAASLGDPKPRPPHRVPLGLLMLSRGDLGPEQLRRALAAQRENGTRRIGEWIEELGYASGHQITTALAAQWACPVLRQLPPRVADCGVPRQLLKRFCMVPVHFARGTGMVHIAFSGNIEYQVLLAIEEMLQCKTAPCLATSAAIESALARLDENERKPEKVFDGLRSPAEMARITSSYAGRLGAKQVRTAACGKYLWIRIEGEGDSTNLVFAKATAENTHPRDLKAAGL